MYHDQTILNYFDNRSTNASVEMKINNCVVNNLQCQKHLDLSFEAFGFFSSLTTIYAKFVLLNRF
jgi:hypothetical protein